MTDDEYLDYYAESRALFPPSMAPWKLIDAASLLDLWPDGEWLARKDSPVDGASQTSDTVPTNEPSSPSGSGSGAGKSKPSLSELALKLAVETALEREDMLEALASVEIPNLQSRLLRYVRDNAGLIDGRPNGAQLVAHALKDLDTKTLDLSYWPSLTGEVIVDIVKNVKTNSIVEVDISNNPHVTAASIKSLVDLCPNLRSITALNTPSLPLKDLQASVDKYKTYSIHHSSSLRAPFANGEVFPRIKASSLENMLADVKRSNNTVTQVFHYLSWAGHFILQGFPEPSVTDPSGIAWRVAAKAIEEADRGLEFRSYSQPVLRNIPVHDVDLGVRNAIEWFPQILQAAVHQNKSTMMMNAQDVPYQWAMALSVGIKVWFYYFSASCPWQLIIG
jgi:hypothetical protein